MRDVWSSQTGRVAMLVVIAFMLLSVTVVTSNLHLSSVLSTDSRVKTNILNR